ncbi:MAG: hypothetical protein ACRD2I_25395 [Vicinamibacterales bacterium]
MEPANALGDSTLGDGGVDALGEATRGATSVDNGLLRPAVPDVGRLAVSPDGVTVARADPVGEAGRGGGVAAVLTTAGLAGAAGDESTATSPATAANPITTAATP